MKHHEGDYVLLSDIKGVDELNAVHDALVAGSGENYVGHPYGAIAIGGICKRRLTVDQVLGRTPAYSYIVMDGTVEVSGPTSYEDACKDAREYSRANPEDTYTVCMVCRVFKARVVVDESSYGEGEE